MNNKVQTFIAFIIGSLAGGAVTYSLLKEKFKQEAQEDIDSVRAWADAQVEDAYNEYRDDVARIRKEFMGEGEEVEIEPAPYVEPVKNGVGVSYQPEEKTNYNSIAAKYVPSEEKKSIDQILRERRTAHNIEEFDKQSEGEAPAVEIKSLNTGFQIISYEDYSNDEMHHDKLSLTYYQGDNVLTDDQDVPVPSPDDIVGPQALTSFGVDSDDSNVVFIRNNTTKVDFEITRSYASFEDVVMGVQSTPRTVKAQPKVKRTKKALDDGEE